MPRKSISLDMTAMCDMAFLLLTFFILTATMKPEDPVPVDTPSSVSDIKLPDSDILTVSIDPEGKVFFGVDGQYVREQVIQSMAKKYGATLTPAQIHEYSLLPAVGNNHTSHLKLFFGIYRYHTKQRSCNVFLQLFHGNNGVL